MNSYPGISIPMRQLRRRTRPDPSSPGMFTPVPRRAACYTTVVCPAMEYATTAWAPHTAQNCNKLEQVQRRAARFACHRYERTASVTAMLNNLKWETLETRRNNQRLTMFYHMQHNMVSISPADYIAPVQLSRSSRSGHDQMYQVPYAQTDVYKYSFFPTTVRMWNALPASAIQSGTISSFEAGISDYYGH